MRSVRRAGSLPSWVFPGGLDRSAHEVQAPAYHESLAELVLAARLPAIFRCSSLVTARPGRGLAKIPVPEAVGHGREKG